MSVREQIEDIFYSIDRNVEYSDSLEYTDEVLDIITATIDERIDQIKLDNGFEEEMKTDYFSDVGEFEAYAQILELEDLKDELLE